MSAEGARTVILVLEGPSDFERIPVIVDHLLEKHGDGTALGDVRRFVGVGGLPYLDLHKIPELARERGLPRYYSPGGKNHGDAGTLRKLHFVLQKEKLLVPGSVILWARDDDGDSARGDREALRAAWTPSSPLLLAIASECGEAWVIAGFRVEGPADAAKIKVWRQELGFEPHVQPHRLSHKRNVPKSAKKVAEDLFDGDREREVAALRLAADSKSQASMDCGLTKFCAEVDAWFTEA